MSFEPGLVTSLAQALEQHAKTSPGKPSVVSHDRRINYRDLNEAVNRLANALLQRITKGQAVCFALPRIPELVITFLGVEKAGGMAVPIDYELPAERIKPILLSLAPGCIIVHESLLDLIHQSLPAEWTGPIVVVTHEPRECLSWDEFLEKGDPQNPSIRTSIDDVVYLNYTSGSTGEPKAAMTTSSNIYWNTVAAIDALGLTSDDVHLCMFAPFTHPHEILARPILLGGTSVLVETLFPKSLARAISNHRVTCMMGLAPMYETLLSVVASTDYDLSSLRIPESGGMYTPPCLVERFQEQIGVPIIPVWGSTETTGIALAQRPGGRILPGSLGRPCMSFDVRIVDDTGCEAAAGEIGELIFSGPAVAQGYYNSSKDNSSCFRNGWYHSGDLARRDESGNFFFLGRATEMMKVGGLKVHPCEIERVSLEHPGIKEISVVSAEDRLRGEVPRAVVVPRPGVELTEKELIVFWRKRMARYKLPRIIEIRDALPRKSPGGKVDKRALKRERRPPSHGEGAELARRVT